MTGKLATASGGDLAIGGRALDQNPAAVYLAGLGAGSRRTYRDALDVMAAWLSGGRADALGLDWAALRFQHTAAIRSALVEKYAPGTARKMIAALRGVLRAAWRLGQMDAEAYRRAVDLEPVRGEKLPAGRSLQPGEIAAMFAACADDPSPAGARDAAILALLRAGLRRAEVAGLQVGAVDPGGLGVTVKGKGDKARWVPLDNGAAAALDDWLAVRGDGPGPLLWRVNKGGEMVWLGLTSQAVYNALAKRAEQAGVRTLTPHDWRRTVAGDLLDAGADLAVVQRILGHANPATTARYDRRPAEASRRAVSLLHTPYKRRVGGKG